MTSEKTYYFDELTKKAQLSALNKLQSHKLLHDEFESDYEREMQTSHDHILCCIADDDLFLENGDPLEY